MISNLLFKNRGGKPFHKKLSRLEHYFDFAERHGSRPTINAANIAMDIAEHFQINGVDVSRIVQRYATPVNIQAGVNSSLVHLAAVSEREEKQLFGMQTYICADIGRDIYNIEDTDLFSVERITCVDYGLGAQLQPKTSQCINGDIFVVRQSRLGTAGKIFEALKQYFSHEDAFIVQTYGARTYV